MSERIRPSRTREQQDSGQQPFKDAREKMGQQDARLRNEPQRLEEFDEQESEEARTERLKHEAEDRLKKVQHDLKKR